jgi:catechol 2,3-dioxygenase-like lactoylglutathione lyase family enzyme
MPMKQERPMKGVCLFALTWALGAPAQAQLGERNQLGIRMGHVHLLVRDLDAQRHFWTSVMGGTLVRNGSLELIEFPDVYVTLEKAADPPPSEGSVVDHFGFIVKDFPAALARWRAAGVEIETTENPNLAHLFTPDGADLEVYGEPALPTPTAMNHLHFYLPDIPAMKSWYVQTFGANPGRRACVRCTFSTPRMIETADMPGTNLSFSPSETRRLPTQGRAIDHVGFDVEDLDTVVDMLEARGIALEGPVRRLPGTTVQSVFLTDPWGTRIELTEGLAPR